jgi:hypothetical protein
VDITESGVQGLPWQSVVLAWANLRSKALGEDGLASKLSQHGDTKNHPGELEGISEDIEVTSGEDEGDGSEVGDTGRAWVLPAQEAVEEGVVVGELLTSGRWVVGAGTGSSQVGQLVGGLCVLVLEILGNGAYREWIDQLMTSWSSTHATYRRRRSGSMGGFAPS